ncbi:mRNA-capping enzyme [Trichogramma pretiosum]|uniref:mRNA-capping enzyme n=1 Tax=Trichogramma pretiosum TaxID=7493 RepID=UPI0006C99B5E|nr:mRNA-capping enzyme [Trichogramma pretiosum]
MSDPSSNGRGPVPPRWLHCPRKSMNLIHNKFVAFKTPLSSDFDDQVPDECRFTVDMLINSLRSSRIKLGLWIDLTNTSRFYDRQEVEAHDIKYLKLQCKGHGETPSREQTMAFIQVCRNFIAQHPLDSIGVHCTHGFNRTGFLIVSYLTETDECSVDASLSEFATARPPGIYKKDYIDELFARYDDIDDAIEPPQLPAWCLEYDDTDQDEDSGEPQRKKFKKETFNKNPIFMAGVPGVKPILDVQVATGICRRVQQICHWDSTGFPGSQPVSMDVQNIEFLHSKPYRVSWKADGTRYMMFIQSGGQVYFIDRDNSVFQVSGLTFRNIHDSNKLLKDTLLDGEMVIDKDKNREYPRYLAYDVIMYDGKDVSKLYFYPDRYSIIEKQIIAGRHEAMKTGKIIKEREPFSVRLKQFWDITQASSLLGEKFTKQLGHEPDGLIFQPSKEPYTGGPCSDILKWKPASLNSVDFRLKIVTETGEGILKKKIGELYVGQLDRPFCTMKYTKQLKDLNNKIIECKRENDQWIFMRERTDKSFPNSYKTAKAVYASIMDPVTKEKLLAYIENHRFSNDDTDLMPPPKNKHR